MSTRDQKCEALVDTIGHLNGCWQNPESDSYRLKSPLLLKSFARVGKHEVTPECRRVFPSMLSGYKAATFDMSLKLSGNSRAGLKPTDLLENLFRVYGIVELLGQKKGVQYLRRSLSDESISTKTPLSYFLTSDTVQLVDREK